MPLYILGFVGMTRRLNHYSVPLWQPWLVVALVGAVFVGMGILAMLVQIYVSVRHRNELRDVTGDPWDGRTLEWSTSSPPPFYNFADRADDHLGRAALGRQGQRPRLSPADAVRGHPHAAQHRRGRHHRRVQPPCSASPSSGTCGRSWCWACSA